MLNLNEHKCEQHFKLYFSLFVYLSISTPLLDADFQLLVLMHSGGLNKSAVSRATRLRFNLCWDDKDVTKAVYRHLNAICIAVGSSGEKYHVDFRTRSYS